MRKLNVKLLFLLAVISVFCSTTFAVAIPKPSHPTTEEQTKDRHANNPKPPAENPTPKK